MAYEKTVGQPCDKCGVPYIMGAKGAYCKPCYIAYKNGQQAPIAPVKPQTVSFDDKSIVMGKCKTLFLVEAFKAHLGNPNIKLSEIEKIAEEWAKASMRILPPVAQDTPTTFGLRQEDLEPPF